MKPADESDDPYTTTLPKPAQTPLFRASQIARYQRQQDVHTIEAATGRRLICYIATPQALLRRSDVAGFADLVHDVEEESDLDVMITTYGGDPDAALRIAYLLRKAVLQGRLTAVIPDAAKSAGTILGVGMDAIIMSDTSELGPVDPQINIPAANGTEVRRPAMAYIAAYEDAITRAAAADATAPVWEEIRLLFDPTTLTLCRQAVARTRDYIELLLRERKQPGTTFTQVAGNLLVPSRNSTHGSVITADEANTIGLDVECLSRGSHLWQAYWRLYCLQMLSLQPGERLFESGRVSLSLPPE